MSLVVNASGLAEDSHESEVLLGQGFEHRDNSLADVGVQVLELARHVCQGGQAVRVKVLILEQDHNILEQTQKQGVNMWSTVDEKQVSRVKFGYPNLLLEDALICYPLVSPESHGRY